MRRTRKACPPILGSARRDSRSFFRFFVDLRGLDGFLQPLELDEIADLLPGLFGEGPEFGHQVPGLSLFRSLRFAEELAHLQIEDLEDLEERVESDLVLALLLARQIVLRHAALCGEVSLREAPLFAQLTNTRADQSDLARRMGRHV